MDFVLLQGKRVTQTILSAKTWLRRRVFHLSKHPLAGRIACITQT